MKLTYSRGAVAAEVRARLSRRRNSQKELATALDIPVTTLRDRMTGRSAFDTDKLLQIAGFLDVDFVELFPTSIQTPFAAQPYQISIEAVPDRIAEHLNTAQTSRDDDPVLRGPGSTPREQPWARRAPAGNGAGVWVRSRPVDTTAPPLRPRNHGGTTRGDGLMIDITPFDFDGQVVRVTTIDGEPWFVLTDLARALGIADTQCLSSRLDDGVRQTHPVRDSLGRTQPATVVSESGVHEVVIRSDEPDTVSFHRWITSDVLPTIRRAGTYGQAPALTGPALVAAALVEAQAILAATTEQVAALTPRAEAFDAFLSTSGDLSVNEAAKILSRDHGILTGEKRLRAWMQANGWIYRNEADEPRAYQRRVDQGALAERARWHHHPETGERVIDTPQVRVTAKGVEALAKALTKVADQGEAWLADGVR
ncbi:prophage antirepressor-like protein/transcriptional regulator with XRE-family HTH domain [Oerskovia enterophila]